MYQYSLADQLLPSIEKGLKRKGHLFIVFQSVGKVDMWISVLYFVVEVHTGRKIWRVDDSSTKTRLTKEFELIRGYCLTEMHGMDRDR